MQERRRLDLIWQGATVASSSASATQLTAANGQLEFLWTQASSDLEATVQPKWSDTLTTWSANGIITQVIADNSTLRTIHTTLPAGTGQRFVRLRVNGRQAIHKSPSPWVDLSPWVD
jgi:hypothetical protein